MEGLMFWFFDLFFPPPNTNPTSRPSPEMGREDAIDRLLKTERAEQWKREVEKSRRFWSDKLRAAEPETRAAMIATARQRYLHQGGKP
jgi:hypothetical protein